MDRLTAAVLLSNSQTPRLKGDSDKVTAIGFAKCENYLKFEAASDPLVERDNLPNHPTYPDRLYSQCQGSFSGPDDTSYRSDQGVINEVCNHYPGGY